MNSSIVFQTGLYLLLLAALAWPLSRYLASLLDGSLAARMAGLVALIARCAACWAVMRTKT